ncbi:MAG TPA: hypothetical protein VMQ60_12160 [Acidobacteriaceae bacterium]|nr:hypothetical protein [Acidobacteriaceae bacterium]
MPPVAYNAGLQADRSRLPCYTGANRVRIPFPERVPIDRVAVFAAVLFAIQSYEGTAIYFSIGCVAFILLAAVAFNTAGGLSRTAGVYVFFYSLLVFIIGVTYKACLGEPADSNLVDPQSDIEAYVGCIFSLLIAVLIARRFSRRTGLLQNLMKDSQMHRSSIGCMAFGVSGGFLIALLGEAAAKLNSAFTQLDQLIPLGIIIGVMYEIRRSGGTRSINTPTAIFAAFYFFNWGLLNFSKQGILLPLLCWALPVCAMRYRLTGVQVITGLMAAFLIFYYLFPFAQYGRDFRQDNASFSQNVTVAVPLLEHLQDTRQKYLEATEGDVGKYYNTSQGFMDRLQFISVDDGLINATDQGKVFGLWPIKAVFLNAVPHVIWPNKPDLRLGNTYAHEFTNIPADDTTTGISFSPTSEVYHWAKWVGVLVVAPLLWLMLFLVYDTLFGDLRASPWGLLVMAQISHSAPEGGINATIVAVTFGVETFVFCAFFATYLAPYFAIPILGPDRRVSAPQSSFRSLPHPTREAP